MSDISKITLPNNEEYNLKDAAARGSLAYIETTSSVSKQDGYQPGEYLVYNGQLYKVTGTISPGETLTPGGNIGSASVGDELTNIFNSLSVAGMSYSAVWTAQSSAHPYDVLTASITVPAGFYIATVKTPYTNNVTGIGSLRCSYHPNIVFSYNNYTVVTMAFVATKEDTFNVISNGSISITYANLSEGWLRFTRIK